jgi:hypothetical protein
LPAVFEFHEEQGTGGNVGATKTHSGCFCPVAPALCVANFESDAPAGGSTGKSFCNAGIALTTLSSKESENQPRIPAIAICEEGAPMKRSIPLMSEGLSHTSTKARMDKKTRQLIGTQRHDRYSFILWVVRFLLFVARFATDSICSKTPAAYIGQTAQECS